MIAKLKQPSQPSPEDDFGIDGHEDARRSVPMQGLLQSGGLLRTPSPLSTDVIWPGRRKGGGNKRNSYGINKTVSFIPWIHGADEDPKGKPHMAEFVQMPKFPFLKHLLRSDHHYCRPAGPPGQGISSIETPRAPAYVRTCAVSAQRMMLPRCSASGGTGRVDKSGNVSESLGHSCYWS